MNGYIINAGSKRDSRAIGLDTRKGNYIENIRSDERCPAALSDAYDGHKKEHPGIEARSLSARYNCMGLVFASRRTSIDVDPTIKLILEDDEYTLVAETKDVQEGDIIVYYKDKRPTHVGIVARIGKSIEKAEFNITILSQWGRDGEYFHSVDNIPSYYGTKFEYWTDRKHV